MTKMAKVTFKFKCTAAENKGTPEDPNVNVTLTAVGVESAENKLLFREVPSGSVSARGLKTNFFELGQEYYLAVEKVGNQNV